MATTSISEVADVACRRPGQIIGRERVTSTYALHVTDVR